MARLWGYFLLSWISWDFVDNTVKLNQAIRELVIVRHNILVNQEQARQLSCLDKKNNKARLFWTEQGAWVNACDSTKKTGHLPRQWLIEYTYNYRMLFQAEAPITFAIVIKH